MKWQLFFIISKEFATGKWITQKYQKCDWSVKRGFSNKNSVHKYRKLTNSIFAFGKQKFYLNIITDEMQIENLLI